VRLYAEDPDNDFLPTAGKIDDFIYPKSSHFCLDYESGIRMDTGVDSGDEVSPFYDPMIAKLIVWGKDRSHAIRKLKDALHRTHISGLTTNVRYLEKLIGLDSFAQAKLDTHFVEDNAESIKAQDLLTEHQRRLHQIIAAWQVYQQRLDNNDRHHNQNNIQSNDVHTPWNMKNGWRLNGSNCDPVILLSPEKIVIQFQPLPSGNYSVLLAEHRYILQAPFYLKDLSNSIDMSHSIDVSLMIKSSDTNTLNQAIKAQVVCNANSIQVHSLYGSSEFIKPARLNLPQTEEKNEQGLHAPMNGCLTEVKVAAGDIVSSGDILVIMEAMKMEHIIKAPHDGIIDQVFFIQGDLVNEGSELLSYEQ
jgi:3-methylcrotonyl-CoA carboxylase alpha subunit